MLVKEAMTKNVIVVNPDATIKDAAKIMTQQRVGSLLVIEGNKLVGIITELDIIWKVVAGDLNPKITLVRDVMTKQVVSVKANQTLEDATQIMVENSIKKLPVLESDKLVGIITATDLISVQPKMIDALAKLLLFEEKKPAAG
ncbi:MAG: CBS domain-containing protein [Candidatus Aenigmarchaeota archaeon]|nr:CBS domain-containing protein [Candidatus Aenigmarchaeota archaeon]